MFLETLLNNSEMEPENNHQDQKDMGFCRVMHLRLASNLQFCGVYSLSNISHFILNYD